MEELTELILQQLRGIGNDVGGFLAGVLSDDISHDEQIRFALRLVRLAEHIRQRATSTPRLIVDNDHTRRDGRPATSASQVTPACLR